LTRRLPWLHASVVNARELLAILAFACASARDGSAPDRGGRANAAAKIADMDPAVAEGGAAAGDAGAADDAPCATDADCGLTNVAPGACCPMLCTPRAVTLKRAGELEARAGCAGKPQRCPEPLCRPPSGTVAAACEAGRCVARTSRVPGN
jgi:hypothetical protein